MNKRERRKKTAFTCWYCTGCQLNQTTSPEIILLFLILHRIQPLYQLLRLASDFKRNRRELIRNLAELFEARDMFSLRGRIHKTTSVVVQVLNDRIGAFTEGRVHVGFVDQVFCGRGNVCYYRGDGGDVGADGGEVCFGADTGDEGLDGLDEAICLVFDVELF